MATAQQVVLMLLGSGAIIGLMYAIKKLEPSANTYEHAYDEYESNIWR